MVDSHGYQPDLVDRGRLGWPSSYESLSVWAGCPQARRRTVQKVIDKQNPAFADIARCG